MSHEEIDTNQVVTYLNHAFDRAMQRVAPVLGTKAHAPQEPTGTIPNGNTLYNYQVEFCYMIDEIQRGPRYIIPKIISNANELISELENETTVTEQDEHK